MSRTRSPRDFESVDAVLERYSVDADPVGVCGVDGCVRELHSASDRRRHLLHAHDIASPSPNGDHAPAKEEAMEEAAPSTEPTSDLRGQGTPGPPSETAPGMADQSRGAEGSRASQPAPEAPPPAPAAGDWIPCTVPGCRSKTMNERGLRMHISKRHPDHPLPPLSGTLGTRRPAAAKTPAIAPLPAPSAPTPPRRPPESQAAELFAVRLRATASSDAAQTAAVLARSFPGAQVWGRLDGDTGELVVVEEVSRG